MGGERTYADAHPLRLHLVEESLQQSSLTVPVEDDGVQRALERNAHVQNLLLRGMHFVQFLMKLPETDDVLRAPNLARGDEARR